jgi:hypothetical protein
VDPRSIIKILKKVRVKDQGKMHPQKNQQKTIVQINQCNLFMKKFKKRVNKKNQLKRE